MKWTAAVDGSWTIQFDNTEILDMTGRSYGTKSRKLIYVRYHFIQDKNHKQKLKNVHIAGKRQKLYVFTKQLGRLELALHCERLQIRQIEQSGGVWVPGFSTCISVLTT